MSNRRLIWRISTVRLRSGKMVNGVMWKIASGLLCDQEMLTSSISNSYTDSAKRWSGSARDMKEERKSKTRNERHISPPIVCMFLKIKSGNQITSIKNDSRTLAKENVVLLLFLLLTISNSGDP